MVVTNASECALVMMMLVMIRTAMVLMTQKMAARTKKSCGAEVANIDGLMPAPCRGWLGLVCSP